MNTTPSPTLAELLALWRRDIDLAESMDVKYTTARQWRERGRLPAQHWPKFIVQLRELFGREVTFEQVTLAYQHARQAKRPELVDAGPPGADAA